MVTENEAGRIYLIILVKLARCALPVGKKLLLAGVCAPSARSARRIAVPVQRESCERHVRESCPWLFTFVYNA